jgi:hypothetical protein
MTLGERQPIPAVEMQADKRILAPVVGDRLQTRLVHRDAVDHRVGGASEAITKVFNERRYRNLLGASVTPMVGRWTWRAMECPNRINEKVGNPGYSHKIHIRAALRSFPKMPPFPFARPSPRSAGHKCTSVVPD